MELLILCIEFIINKLNLGIAVTINTPAHTQVTNLSYPVHFLNGTMTGKAFDLSNCYMLCMAEKDMILQVMHLDPLDGSLAFPGFNHFVNLVFP
jgi:predicted glycosyltransferase involved in capsule biosynthesis